MKTKILKQVKKLPRKPTGHNPSNTGHEQKNLTAWAKGWSGHLLGPISRALIFLGIQPNLLSMVGLFFAFAAAGLVATGYIFQGGVVFFLSGLFDAMDGALARTAGLESQFGAFLDSFMDRYSEAAVLFGILYWATYQNRHDLVLLAFIAIVGSFMVSYARARAEGLRISCQIGLFTRLERFIVLTVTLMTGQVLLGLAILSFMANFTAWQRLFHVFRQSDQ